MTVALIIATAVIGIGCLAGAVACLSAQRGLSMRAESGTIVHDRKATEETTSEL